jgi:predicted RNA-binding protein with PIN domain
MKALVVDGYNVVHKIPHLEALLDTSLREARDAVTKLAIDYQRKIGGIKEVNVVFDGKDEYRYLNSSAPPHQIFSKSGEGDRAIIRTVQRLSGRYHVLVVSDDNYVKNNSRAHNASTISVLEFTAAIKKNNARKT